MQIARLGTGGLIPMFVFGVIMVLVCLVYIPYAFSRKKKHNYTVPDRSPLYRHDFFGAVKDSPLHKRLSFIEEFWGEPNLTFRSGGVVYRCWKVEEAYMMKPGEKLFFVFGFDKKKDICVSVETDPVSEEFLQSLGYRPRLTAFAPRTDYDSLDPADSLDAADATGPVPDDTPDPDDSPDPDPI